MTATGPVFGCLPRLRRFRRIAGIGRIRRGRRPSGSVADAGAFGRGEFVGPIALLVAASAGMLGCDNNPVHDAQVQALGPEDPAVPAGPMHRAGQPCLVCHGQFGPASMQFAVGGTIYAKSGDEAPAVGATAAVEDVNGAVASATTNAAGNFYIPSSDFEPKYPVRCWVTSADGITVAAMKGYVARNGSCAACHLRNAGARSVGPVVLATDAGGRPAAAGEEAADGSEEPVDGGSVGARAVDSALSAGDDASGGDERTW